MDQDQERHPTLTDHIIPYYVWFCFGFGLISIGIGILNFGMLLVTMITVRGITIPLWMIPITAMVLVAICILTGYFFERYGIWERMVSHQNRNANPEITEILANVSEIKKLVEQEKRNLLCREHEVPDIPAGLQIASGTGASGKSQTVFKET